MTKEDTIIVEEYKEVFRKYAKDGIIDLDNRLKHKFTFRINRLEDIFEEVGGVIPPTRQSHFIINLVKKGTGEKIIGHHSFPIRNKLLFFIPRQMVHSSRFLPGDCSGYSLSFNLDFFLQNIFPKQHIVKKKIFRSFLKPYLVLSGIQEKKLETIFESILNEYINDLESKNEMIAIKTLELLLQCERFFVDESAKEQHNINNDTIENFNKLMQQHYLQERSVQFYANALHMHPNRLNFLVKKHTGLTAKETIIDHILLEAKFLLHSSSLTIKEIGYKLGFDDPNYFTSFFCKKMNMSPATYRNQFV